MGLVLTRRIAGSQRWADAVAERLQPALRSLLERSPRLRDALDGRWLGTPLHPVLTDVPVGALSAAAVLDLVGGRERALGNAPLAVGVVAALPTALTGVSDWAHLRGEERRIATVHAALNGGALVLNVASLTLRAAGRRGAGKALSLAAYGLLLASAHLGGQLVQGLGVRVNRTAWQSGGEEFRLVLRADELTGEAVRRVELDGVPVLLARCEDGEVCAIAATCTHLGGPLDEGERRGDTIVCPWHASTFDLRTGAVVHAPAVFPQPRYETRVTADGIAVRRAG